MVASAHNQLEHLVDRFKYHTEDPIRKYRIWLISIASVFVVSAIFGWLRMHRFYWLLKIILQEFRRSTSLGWDVLYVDETSARLRAISGRLCQQPATPPEAGTTVVHGNKENDGGTSRNRSLGHPAVPHLQSMQCCLVGQQFLDLVISATLLVASWVGEVKSGSGGECFTGRPSCHYIKRAGIDFERKLIK